MSNRGILVLAQNNESVDYVQQACLLAMSLKLTNPDEKISLVTNDTVAKTYTPLFDKIIEIPWQDDAEHANWKIQNRWKLYHCTPYDKTIVMDTDMLVLQNIENWWEFLSRYKLFFTSSVLTYRNEIVTDDFYRKAFTKNNLPNIYSGLHYFEQSDFALEFYTYLELVVQNWKTFYEIFLQHDRPTWCSIDVCCAIVTILLDCEDDITNKIAKFPTFVHMKPNIQNWFDKKVKWQDHVDTYFNNSAELKIGNHQQDGVFHYTEKDFVKPYMLSTYRNLLDV